MGISRSLLDEQAQKFQKNFYMRNKQFWTQINAIRANLTSALETIKKAKEASKNLKAYWEGMIKTEETKLKKIEADISRLNTVITNKRNEVKATITQKQTCDEEHVNLLLAIQTEELKIKKKNEEIAKNLADAKKARQAGLKILFYWLEASYFYRVFAEKLVKNVADLDKLALTLLLKEPKLKLNL